MTAIYFTSNVNNLRFNEICYLANENLRAFHYAFTRIDLKVGIFFAHFFIEKTSLLQTQRYNSADAGVGVPLNFPSRLLEQNSFVLKPELYV